MVPEKKDSPEVTSGATSDTDAGSGPAGQETQAFHFQRDGATIDLPKHDQSGIQTLALSDASGYSISEQPSRRASAVLHTSIGDYEVMHELGRGGMGVVYRARHRQLQRDVALKMVLAGAYAGQEQRDRFLTEAKSVAKLQHPNIVQIFDIGEQDGLPYFSLEFVDGQSLAENIRKQPMTPADAAKIVERLARAMQYAHDHGVLHRDLKPANVLLTKEGTPKISDFGLAKQIEDSNDAGTTRTGTIMGTPSYMSPEQARGSVHNIGPASDEYSLGAILYELLTGRPPFRAAHAVETVMQVIHDEPVAPRQLQPKLPVDLETICLKALHKDVAKRYGSCERLADDLRRFQAGEPIQARPVSNLQRAWRWCRRNPRIAIPSSLAIMFLCAAVIISTASWRKVSNQNLIIVDERDKATKLKILAESEADNAKRQEGIAKERAAAAKKQAELVMKNMQLILDEVDSQLSQVPAVTDTRLRVLETITKAWDEIDKSVRDDEEGAAVPTLMVARQKMADVFLSLGKLNLYDEEVRKLYDIAKHRINVKQGTDGSRLNLALICNNLGDSRQQVHRDMVRSRAFYHEALRLFRDIQQHPKRDPKTPSIPQYTILYSLGGTLQNLGVSYLRSGQLQEADQYFQEALREREGFLEFVKTDPEFAAEDEFKRKAFVNSVSTGVDKSYLAQAEIRFRLGDTAQAENINLEALRRRKDIFERDPADFNNRTEYARFKSHTGEFYLMSGRPSEGRALMQTAVAELATLSKENPKIASLKDFLSYSCYRFGCLLDELGNAAKAREQFQKCRELRDELLRDTKDSQKRQSQLMLAMSRCGEIDLALELADSLRKTAKPDAELLLERARAMSQSSRYTKSAEQRTMLTNAAFEALQSAIDTGYRDPFKIRTEPDFKPLREDPRFQYILTQAASAPSQP